MTELYDLRTPEGVRNSITWFNNFVTYIKPQGTWAIPRALTTYQVDADSKTLTRTFGDGDATTELVARAAGWTIHGEQHD